MKIRQIWWRRVTGNDLYNVEKPLPPGPKGQLHLDVPNVEALQQFFGITPGLDKAHWGEITVDVKVLRSPDVSRELTFRPRPSNDRYDIRLQNINSDSSERHPAWTSAYGWPTVHGLLESTSEAQLVLADNPLVVFLAQDFDGEYFADFISGTRIPIGWPIALEPLFSGKSAGYIGPFESALAEEIGELLAGERPMELPSVEVPESTIDGDGLVSFPDVKTTPKFREPKAGATPTGSNNKSRGQGYGLSSPEKQAVEKHAVSLAIKYFESAGWQNIQDVGANASYDLTMIGGGVVHIVEVKGTTGRGESVLLTKNEVSVHGAYHPNNALVVVSNIKLDRKTTPPTASGGNIKVVQPWKLEESKLTTLTFSYEVDS